MTWAYAARIRDVEGKAGSFGFTIVNLMQNTVRPSFDVSP